MDHVHPLHCDCGYVARGESLADVVAVAQRHARIVHGLELPAGLLLRDACRALGGVCEHEADAPR